MATLYCACGIYRPIPHLTASRRTERGVHSSCRRACAESYRLVEEQELEELPKAADPVIMVFQVHGILIRKSY